MPSAPASNAKGTSSSRRRRRRREPSSHPPVEPNMPSGSMVQASSSGLPPVGASGPLATFPKIFGTLVLSAVAVIVMVDVLLAPELSVTLAGANAHDAPSGSPEQASVTGPAKPPVDTRATGEV